MATADEPVERNYASVNEWSGFVTEGTLLVVSRVNNDKK